MPRIQTPLTEMLGIEKPIMLAGMGGIATKDLVAAVTNAGGFGTLGGANALANGPEGLRAELSELKAMCGGKPFGVDILIPGGEGGVMSKVIKVFKETGVRAFVSGLGYPAKETVEQFHESGILVGSIAGKAKHAANAVEAGVDFIVAQGSEAGGHTGQVATSVLLPQVLDAVGHKVPVVAAGGIFDGRGLAAALAMGASGAWIGTRFLATPEAYITQEVKELLIKAEPEDTVVTKAFTGRTLRALKNKYQAYYDAHPEEMKGPGLQTAQSTKDGCWDAYFNKPVDLDKVACPCGQNVGCIHSIQPAGMIVDEMANTAEEILAGRRSNFTLLAKSSL